MLPWEVKGLTTLSAKGGLAVGFGGGWLVDGSTSVLIVDEERAKSAPGTSEKGIQALRGIETQIILGHGKDRLQARLWSSSKR